MNEIYSDIEYLGLADLPETPLWALSTYLGACASGQAYLRNFSDAAKAWAACREPCWLGWAVARLELDPRPLIRVALSAVPEPLRARAGARTEECLRWLGAWAAGDRAVMLPDVALRWDVIYEAGRSCFVSDEALLAHFAMNLLDWALDLEPYGTHIGLALPRFLALQPPNNLVNGPVTWQAADMIRAVYTGEEVAAAAARKMDALGVSRHDGHGDGKDA